MSDATLSAAPVPPRRRKPGEIPWGEIRAVYEGTDIPLETLASAYAIRVNDIYPRAERDSWMLRRERWALERKAERLTGQKPPPVPERGVLIGRLFQAVGRQIDEIERRAADQPDHVPDEKDARMLAALARTLDVLIGLEKTGDKRDTEATRSSMDEFRRELARRIENLGHAG